MERVQGSSWKLRGIAVIIILSLFVCANIALVHSNVFSTFDASSLVPQIFQCHPRGDQKESNVSSKAPKAVAVDQRVWLRYKGRKWRGLQLPVIAMDGAGRLGNMMGIYATIYGLGKTYNVTVRQLNGIKTYLSDVFSNLSIPVIPGEYNSSEWIVMKYYGSGSYGGIEAAAAGLFGPRLFVAVGASFEIQLFNAYRKEILNEFTFSSDIQQKVDEFWKEQMFLTKGLTFVGFHIRRTDYVNYIKSKKAHLPGPVYFRNAMNFYREKFPPVLFVVASDDMTFARSTLANTTDVIFVPGKRREIDMAILASCNHSIITVGSFGFWTGYLTGGMVVYPNISALTNYPFQRERYEMSGLDFFVMLPSD